MKCEVCDTPMSDELDIKIIKSRLIYIKHSFQDVANGPCSSMICCYLNQIEHTANKMQERIKELEAINEEDTYTSR